RAFPELDGYTDEQCARFVRAARGSVRRRVIAGAIIALVTLIGISAGLVGFWYVQSTWLDPHRSLNIGHQLVTWYGLLLNIVLAIAGVTLGPILGYLTRDLFVIRRVRFILRTRGTCISCGYTLVGLFVGEELQVICPECGTTTQVDPALGELVTDEAGRPSFKPAESRHKARIFWTRRRRRVLGFGSLALAILALVLSVSYELFIRWQAGIARREQPSVLDLQALATAYQPEGTRPSDPNAFDVLMKLSLLRTEADHAVWLARGSPSFGMYPDYQMIYAPERVGDLGELHAVRLREIQEGEAVARMLLEKQRELGVPETLAILASTRRYVPGYDIPPGQPLFLIPLKHLGDSRQLAMACLSRMRLAAEDRDLAAFSSAMEGSLALARVLRLEPNLISHLVSYHIEMETHGQIRLALASSPDAEWLDAISDILERQRSSVPHEFWIRSEALTSHNLICHFFNEPHHARFGRWSRSVRQLRMSLFIGDTMRQPSRLGTYYENRKILREQEERFREVASTPLRERGPHDSASTSLIPAWYCINTDPTETLDQSAVLQADRDGLDIMIALERFRLAEGEYPDSLERIVPAYMEALPLDPWSGVPYVYRRPGDSDHCAPAGYVLYSIGSDQVDNGGRPPPARRAKSQNIVMGAAKKRDCVGLDWIINSAARNH
ncbi:MAG: type II secretion system protein GspG, partial [Phycisphaeraceae bacterium]|nr:type II secretion system protein GspG [Phycisphaeraceae bacterium]